MKPSNVAEGLESVNCHFDEMLNKTEYVSTIMVKEVTKWFRSRIFTDFISNESIYNEVDGYFMTNQ